MCKLQGFKTKICTFSQGNFKFLQKNWESSNFNKKTNTLKTRGKSAMLIKYSKKSEFQGNSTFPKSCDYLHKQIFVIF